MLHSITTSRAAVDIERSALFNLSHSEASFFANIELAFVTRTEPSAPATSGSNGPGVRAMVGWVGRAGAPLLLDMENPAELQTVVALLQQAQPEDVVRARPALLRTPVLEALNRIGYHFDIPGSEHRVLRGWQDESEEEARRWASLRPSVDRTMALLSKSQSVAGSSPALILTTSNDQWFVQTEIGGYAITGGSLLLRGEPIYFVQEGSFRLWKLLPTERADLPSVQLGWGPATATRMDPNGRAIVVNLEAVP